MRHIGCRNVFSIDGAVGLPSFLVGSAPSAVTFAIATVLVHLRGLDRPVLAIAWGFIFFGSIAMRGIAAEESATSQTLAQVSLPLIGMGAGAIFVTGVFPVREHLPPNAWAPAASFMFFLRALAQVIYPLKYPLSVALTCTLHLDPECGGGERHTKDLWHDHHVSRAKHTR